MSINHKMVSAEEFNVWDHYTQVRKGPKTSADIVACNYCQRETRHNAIRCCHHLASCSGAVPPEVRVRWSSMLVEL